MSNKCSIGDLEYLCSRLKIWSDGTPNDPREGEPASVNYHWGMHAGMVSRSKEVLPYLESALSQLKAAHRELDRIHDWAQDQPFDLDEVLSLTDNK